MEEMRPPEFWSRRNGVAALLEPLGWVYSLATALRLKLGKSYKALVPVISVGNLSVGGTGKTPVVQSLCKLLSAQGRTPHVVLRGYGGRLKGPILVDLLEHKASDVGDEALLHARVAPTWVSARRDAGVKAAEASGADIIVLDDAHQNPSVYKDLNLVVVDGSCGFMNAKVLPAGPLREPVKKGLLRADALIMMGADQTGLSGKVKPLPVIRADIIPCASAHRFQGRKVVAFAGIGKPEKMLASLQAVGAQIIAFHPFDDHQPYGQADIEPILDEAFSINAVPVTTAKDAVRLDPDQRQQVDVLDVEVRWQDPDVIGVLLRKLD